MATTVNTTTIVTDDLTGAEGAVTIKFGLDGKNFTIDLTSDNEAKLRKFLTKYVEAATEEVPAPAPTPRTRRSNGNRSRPNHDAAAIRAWAQANGIQVGSRGRLDSEVIEAYHAAQAPAEAPKTSAEEEKEAALNVAKALAVLHDEKIETASV